MKRKIYQKLKRILFFAILATNHSKFHFTAKLSKYSVHILGKSVIWSCGFYSLFGGSGSQYSETHMNFNQSERNCWKESVRVSVTSISIDIFMVLNEIVYKFCMKYYFPDLRSVSRLSWNQFITSILLICTCLCLWSQDIAFQYLWNCKEYLDKVHVINDFPFNWIFLEHKWQLIDLVSSLRSCRQFALSWQLIMIHRVKL